MNQGQLPGGPAQQLAAEEKAYRDWLANPFTQHMLKDVAVAASPPIVVPGSVPPEAYAYWLGLYTGYSLLRRLVFDKPDLLQDREAMEQLQRLIPSYTTPADLAAERTGRYKKKEKTV